MNLKKTGTVTWLALIVGAVLAGTAGCDSPARRCAEQGGIVREDVDTKVKVKNGKRVVTTEREYECVAPDGRELFEWK